MNMILNKSTSSISYRLTGEGNHCLVILGAMASSMAEWWHIQDELVNRQKVLTYDRLGYGESDTPKTERSPNNIANELIQLLAEVAPNDTITLLGHSQGGIYAIQVAKILGERVKKVILIDPATPYDKSFLMELPENIAKNGPTYKVQQLRLADRITKLRLGWLFRSILKKGVPFFYYKFETDASTYILKSLTKHQLYSTALAEYSFNSSFKTTLLKTKVILLLHDPKKNVEELVSFASLLPSDAQCIDNIWIKIMTEFAKESSGEVEIMIVPNASHYVHLTNKQFLMDIITPKINNKY